MNRMAVMNSWTGHSLRIAALRFVKAMHFKSGMV